MFLCDVKTAEFSKLKSYISEELKNPNSINTVNTPGFSPINSLKKNISKTTTLAGIGTAKYIKDNKLNRRQRRQAEKWGKLFAPPQPTKPKFFNPFRKKTTLPTTQTTVK